MTGRRHHYRDPEGLGKHLLWPWERLPLGLMSAEDPEPNERRWRRQHGCLPFGSSWCLEGFDDTLSYVEDSGPPEPATAGCSTCSQKKKNCNVEATTVPPSGLPRHFTPHRLLLRHAGMEPPRSQPWLESVERRPVLLLPAGGTCFGFLSAFFFTCTQIPGIQK